MDRRTLIGGLALGGLAAPTMLQAATRAPTPLEFIGPFYPIARPRDQDFDLTRLAGHRERAVGEVIELRGRILGVDGLPIAGALIDIWQANAAGRYTSPNDTNDHLPRDPNFQGSAKLTSARDGGFHLRTIKPGPYPNAAGRMRTRHLHFDVMARNFRLITQMYFPGEPLNEQDALYSSLKRRNLDPAIATCTAAGTAPDGVMRYDWDIVVLNA
jgi:protocatechuate 3,4-dioxygenase, beta subunit